MPELPEVEVTRRRIAPMLVGRTIRAVRTTPSSYFFLTPPKELGKRLIGRRFAELTRHGKYLGMTGQLFTASARSVRLLSSTRGGALVPEAQAAFVADAHTHLQLSFDDDAEDVLFRDVRKFGKVLWIARGADDPRLTKLGPDALTVTDTLLHAETRGRKAPITRRSFAPASGHAAPLAASPARNARSSPRP
jgi:formamidopyrimidine-DNA glycosylase